MFSYLLKILGFGGWIKDDKKGESVCCSKKNFGVKIKIVGKGCGFTANVLNNFAIGWNATFAVLISKDFK